MDLKYCVFKRVWLEPFSGPSYFLPINRVDFPLYFSNIFLLLELDLVLCVTTPAGGDGTEAVVPDFSDLDNAVQEVLMATQKSPCGFMNMSRDAQRDPLC